MQVISLVRECSRRILELCKNKNHLKDERKEAKRLREKIVGVGSTTYNDYSMDRNNYRSEQNYSHRMRGRELEEKENNDEHYDPYIPKNIDMNLNKIIEEADRLANEELKGGINKNKKITENQEIKEDVNFLD